jgi:CRP-like cAMP-binding protein
MLSLDEIRSVSLFSSLAGAQLEHLARTAADIQLATGELAVPEGGEGALFAVLAGKIEVFKTIDGIERHLGWRMPGAIFGEVPLALGTPFPGGYRAVEPSRVMRVEVRDYYALAAAAPDLATAIGALARERDARGYVLTGDEVVKAGRWAQPRDPYLLETSIPGVFACGDVRLSPVKRVAAAVGEGSMAIAFVHQFLQQAARA